MTETAIRFEKALKEIFDKHLDLDSKLSIIQNFMNQFQQKFKFFESLIEDKKNLEARYTALEVKSSQNQLIYNEREVVQLREQLLRVSNELEIKNVMVKNYEEMNKQRHISNKPIINHPNVKKGDKSNPEHESN